MLFYRHVACSRPWEYQPPQEVDNAANNWMAPPPPTAEDIGSAYNMEHMSYEELNTVSYVKLNLVMDVNMAGRREGF